MEILWDLEEMEKRLADGAATGGLDEEQKAHHHELKVRILNLKKPGYRKDFKRDLQKFCKVRLLKPQRQIKLTAEEEKVRCRLTWQMLDRKLWEICFGGDEVLKEHVLDVPTVKKSIKSAVLGFSDQVPWWGLVQTEKQLYLHAELGRAGGKRVQKRGFDNEVASKFRVTLELRQVIHNWCDDAKDPVGVLDTSLLIVGGVHCRLSNIDAAGRWVKTEKFVVAGVAKTHVAGRSALGSMASWVKLRSERPDLFEHVDVMQQPAAVMDSILFAWVVEAQAMKYPVSLWQRDLSGGGGYALQSMKAMQVANQVPTWILGKMTSVLQITDTGFARPLKVNAIGAKAAMRQQLKAAAAQTGAETTLKCGPLEIMTIIHESLEKLVEDTAGKNLVLAEGLRNGLLAYRPNWKTGKLESVEGQAWTKDLPKLAESHRLDPSWSADRLSWRDAEGIPTKAAAPGSVWFQDFLEIQGNPREIQGTSKEYPRKSKGNPRKSKEHPRKIQGNPMEIQGIPRGIQGTSKDIQGNPKEIQGNPRDIQGTSKENPRTSTGNPRKSKGNPRNIQGKSKEIQGRPRKVNGNPRKSKEISGIQGYLAS